MTEKQNILLISWDSVRADHMSFHGYDRETTPYLTEKAEDEGLIFEEAHVSGVGTPTSFTGVFTGEHAHADQTCIEPEHWKAANEDRRLLSEALQDEGYYTGAVHSNALMSRYYGWSRGWDVYKDNLWTEAGDSDAEKWWNKVKKKAILPTLRKAGLAGAAIHGRNILLKKPSYASWESMWDDVEDFIHEAPEPWFLWVLLVDTHHPWHPPEKYKKWPQPGFRKTHLWNYIMRRYPDFTGKRKRGIVNAYDNELRHADAFFEELDGLLQRTGNGDAPIIFHSDHGDELGEHREYGHKPAMWDTLTRVPLVIFNTDKTGREKGVHSLKNIGSTVLDLAGSSDRLGGKQSLVSRRYSSPGSVYIENRRKDGTRIASIATSDGCKAIYEPGKSIKVYEEGEGRVREKVTTWYSPKAERAVSSLEKELMYRDNGVTGSESGEQLDPDIEERLTNLGYIE
jgi:arylsulfatase A-like enzyme